MSRRSRNLATLRDGANCIFCGGLRNAETIEHAPPISLFVGKHRPKGYEFPACLRCNKGSSEWDQVASFFALVAGEIRDPRYGNRDSSRLIQGIANNIPEVLDCISLDGADARDPLIPENIRNSVGVVSLSRKLHRKWLNPWAAKQTFALWFEHSNLPVTKDQRVFTQWFSNYSLAIQGFPTFLDTLLTGRERLSQGRKDFGSQFSYNYAISSETGVAGFLLTLHQSVAVFTGVVNLADTQNNPEKFDFGELFRSNPSQGIILDLGM